MEVIIPLLVFLTVSLFIVIIFSGGQLEEERLKNYAYGHTTGQRDQLAKPFFARAIQPNVQRIAQVVAGLSKDSMQERAKRRLDMAGRPGGIGVTGFLAIQFTSALALPAVLVLAFVSTTSFGLLQVAMVLVSFWLGRRLPDVWLGFRIGARKRRIERDLPDAIDLITVCIEAGQSLDASLAKVAEHERGPLGQEFDLTLKEMNMGKSRREALRALGQRSASPDLAAFVTAIIHADEMGMDIGDVIRAQADQMRIRRRQRAEERAMKAPVKLLFPTIFFLLPCTGIVIIGPVAIKIWGFISQMSSRGG